MPTHVSLTGRFAEAVTYALVAHAGQVRTGTDLPYATHLLGVTSLVLEHGGNELQATAAVLHDAVEDQGGARRLEDIRARFGDDVAELVEALSDVVLLDGEPEPSWRSRKGSYVEHLRPLVDARHPSCLVSLCDKLHNVRAIVADLTAPDGDGEAVWGRFAASPTQMAWYYRSLADVFATADLPGGAVRDLEEAVTRLEGLVEQATSG